MRETPTDVTIMQLPTDESQRLQIEVKLDEWATGVEAQVKAVLLQEVLKQNGGDKVKTAKTLGISLKTIYNRLEMDEESARTSTQH